MDKDSSFEGRPVVDDALLHGWKLNQRQVDKINGAGEPGCFAWIALVVGLVAELLCWATEASSFCWIISLVPCAVSLCCFVASAIGKVAYLHLCSADEGRLRLYVFARGKVSYFQCSHCDLTEKIEGGVPNPELAIIVLSGLYGWWRAPTKIAGQCFHPSEVKFQLVHDPGYYARKAGAWDGKPVPMYGSLTLRTNVRTPSAQLIRARPLELKLEEVMATRRDLVGYRFRMNEEDFREFARQVERAEQVEKQKKTADELAAVLVETEEKVYETSRFGRSREAAGIRRFIGDELRRVLGESHPVTKLLSEHEAQRSSTKKAAAKK